MSLDAISYFSLSVSLSDKIGVVLVKYDNTKSKESALAVQLMIYVFCLSHEASENDVKLFC